MFTPVLHYLYNFAGIFAGICLFFAPFVAVFAWREREGIRAHRPRFNQFVERFLMSPESNALVFTWAAAEAVAWFVIPEFFLVLVVFMKLRRKFDLVKYDILGTIAGTLFALWWRLPQAKFVHIPFIRPHMVSQVTMWYNQHGVWGLLHQPFSGVPYKVFTHQAADFHFFIPLFLLVAISARMVRYLVIYELAQLLYPPLHRFVQRNYAYLFVGAIVVFTFLLLHVVQIYQ